MFSSYKLARLWDMCFLVEAEGVLIGLECYGV